eukprot:gb/GECG01012058.1/.p1 GENE.gb/GECG01012058.1/~~gb/GECG01012058.1/.p1  ORF type:complete len:167 (+),score=21.34 gb/GECG01012058.1/:1-501(+)
MSSSGSPRSQSASGGGDVRSALKKPQDSSEQQGRSQYTGDDTPVPSTPATTAATETDEQKVKQVEKLLRQASRPHPSRPVRYSVQFEGWVKKKADRGIPGFKNWNRRYAVLYNDSQEIRYYGNMVRSNFGKVPLNEHSSIPLHHIISVVPNEAQKWKGTYQIKLTT